MFPQFQTESTAAGNRLALIAERPARVLVIFAAFMEITFRTLEGTRFQRELEDCYRAGIATEKDLWDWVRDKFELRRARISRFETATRRAEAWLSGGRWLASRIIDGNPEAASFSCPSIVFGRGEIARTGPLFTWFNSRKPRLVDVDSAWLAALKATLRQVQSISGRFGSSSGTLTYDLVSAFAIESSSPLICVMPEAIDQESRTETETSVLADPSFTAQVSCQFASNRCSKALRWACRDRILAFLGDIHVVLQLRHPGQLVRILAEQHRIDPRPLWILDSEPGKDPASSGNRELVELFPGRTHTFYTATTRAETRETQEAGPSQFWVCNPVDVPWKDYLFHYTRACPGPWPGESLPDYHLSLLQDGLPASHTARDALVRILLEGRIRASARLLRGNHPVVSFSSRAPGELGIFRQWNRSQARWTLEPYGVAVRRSILKKMGAKPTIYGAESITRRLRPEDGFRFQLDDSSKRWRAEREWRLKGGLRLGDLAYEDFFVFVPGQGDADRIGLFISQSVRCVVSSA